MSKVIKGVTVYGFLLLGVTLVGAMIIAGAMFLSAAFGTPLKVFGYNAVYIARTSQEDLKQTLIDHNSETPIKVNVDAKDYFVTLAHKSDDYKEVIVQRNDNVLGFYKNDLNLKTNLSFEDGVLNVVVAPNEGLMSFNKSKVTIYLPKTYTYDLNLKTNAGNIKIEGNNTNIFPIREIVAETNTGGLSVENIVPSNSANKKVSFDKLIFRTNRGVFDLTNIETLELNNPSPNNKIELNAKRGDFLFKDINAPINITGSDVRISGNVINTLNNGFSFNSPAGYFKITKIITGSINQEIDDLEEHKNIIETTSINIEIDEIVGQTTIKTIYGNIKIGELHNHTVIESVEGDIEIKNANKYVNITNQMGKIVVNGYKESAYFKNNKGTIDVKYNGNENIENINNYVTEIESVKGGIIVNNIYNKLKLKTVSSNVNLDFKKLPEGVNLVHEITTTNSQAKLNLLANVAFFLNSSGNVSGEIGSANITSSTTSFLDAAEGASVVFKLTTQGGEFKFVDKT